MSKRMSTDNIARMVVVPKASNVGEEKRKREFDKQTVRSFDSCCANHMGMDEANNALCKLLDMKR